MNETMIIYGVIGIFAAVGLVFGGIWVIRRMKGTIVLRMNNGTANSGEPLSGSIDLTINKAMQSNALEVALIAKETIKERRDGKTHTRSEEVYRSTKTIEGPTSYNAGDKNSYTFEINAPTGADSSAKISGTAGMLLGVASQFVGSNRRVEWKLEARLDAPGLDLVTTKSVHVNVII